MNGVSSHWIEVATIGWIPKQIVVLGATRQIIAAENNVFLGRYNNLQKRLSVWQRNATVWRIGSHFNLDTFCDCEATLLTNSLYDYKA